MSNKLAQQEKSAYESLSFIIVRFDDDVKTANDIINGSQVGTTLDFTDVSGDWF